LTLNDLHKFKQPKDIEFTLDSHHLGTLFALNKSKDGRFYLDDIVDLIHLYFDRHQKTNTVDVVKEFQGYCTLQLWNFVNKKGGKEKFVKWFVALLSHGNTIRIPDCECKFVGRGAIKSLHEIFGITKFYGIEQATSFRTMQAVALEKNWIPEKVKTQCTDLIKDAVPVLVLDFFALEFITGFMNYMKELGFEPDMEVK